MVSRKVYAGVILGTCVASWPFFKKAIQPLPTKKIDAKYRTAIVTGATGNLGLAITYHLVTRKCRVIMACRDMEKCKLARRELVLLSKSKNMVCRHLDLEDVESINKFAKDVSAAEPHIDIIINNAAIKFAPEKQLTKYGIERQYFVNFLAPFLLTFELLEKLNEAAKLTRDSRVVNVIGTPKRNWNVDLDDINFEKRPYDSNTAYYQSKLALAYFTILLDKYNKDNDNNIYVYGTSPCFKHIEQSFRMFRGFKMGPKALFDAFIRSSPNQASSSTFYLALDPDSAERKWSGQLYTYFLSSFGWNGVDKDEVKATKVWNHAVQTLLSLKDLSKDARESPNQSLVK